MMMGHQVIGGAAQNNGFK